RLAIAATQTAEAQRLAAAAAQTAIAAATLTAQAQAITVYRVSPTSFVCGPRPANDSNDDGRIGIRLIPDDQNRKIQVELSKCNFTPFGKSGQAFVYIDGVQRLGPYPYSSGKISNYFDIDPLAIGVQGSHRYEVYIYPDGENDPNEDPPHISSVVNAWDDVIYP
ncbi:MAG: hypothetical protein ACPGWR_24080, partial [Ardenticatenaceae bacterium]